MTVKEFLDRDRIRELIAAGDLEAVYREYFPHLRLPMHNYLSDYLLNKGINPLDYFKNSIPRAAFHGCNDLTYANILDSVTEIKVGAFPFCHNLTDVKIGNSVIEIGSEAFYGCDNLTSINIPDTVTNIGTHAFFGCGSLTSVTIGENSQLTIISNGAFGKCINLTSVTIPSSITEIGKFAFESCTSLIDIQYRGTKEQWKKITMNPVWRYNSSISVIHCVDGKFVLEF